MALKIIHGLDELRKLKSTWYEFSMRHHLPTQSYDWIYHCADLFRMGDRLEVVLLNSDTGVAIAPLFHNRNGFLELVGADQLFEMADLVYGDDTEVFPLVDAIASLRHPLRLRRVPAFSATVSAIKRSFRGRGFIRYCEDSGCPKIHLDETWTQPEAHLNGRRRYDLRRARRAAESIGEVSCDVVTPTPKELPLLLAEAFAVEAKGWKGRAGTALACDKIRGEFYRRFTAAACELGILRLCFLRIGGEAVAMQIAVQMADAFWLLKVGYDEKYRNCSPGNLLIWETIRYASSERLSTYEFLGLDEQWIHAFTDVVQPTLTIEVYPASILGGAVLARDAFLSLRRKTTKFIKKSINEKNA